jgi:hypothetical protein
MLLTVSVIVAALGPQINWILGLIALDFILAVAVAIKCRRFDLARVADTFRTNIIPKLLGWFGAAILMKFYAPGLIPPGYEWLGPGLADALFFLVVVALGGSILKHLKRIGFIPKPLEKIIQRIGVQINLPDLE